MRGHASGTQTPPVLADQPKDAEVGDFYFCWKPAGMVLQCVTDFKRGCGWDRTRLDGTERRSGAATGYSPAT
jgi:hypothetical protein